LALHQQAVWGLARPASAVCLSTPSLLHSSQTTVCFVLNKGEKCKDSVKKKQENVLLKKDLSLFSTKSEMPLGIFVLSKLMLRILSK
jgi:hypothetical protein